MRGFPTQMASNAENVSIWWRDHGHKIPHILLHGMQTPSGHNAADDPLKSIFAHKKINFWIKYQWSLFLLVCQCWKKLLAFWLIIKLPSFWTFMNLFWLEKVNDKCCGDNFIFVHIKISSRMHAARLIYGLWAFAWFSQWKWYNL